MALSKVDNAQISLFSLSAGELVSEESYWGDTLYYILLGEIIIHKDKADYKLSAGSVMAVAAHTSHAIQAEHDTKLLQITLNK